MRSPGRIAPHVMDDIAESLRFLGHAVWILDLHAQDALAVRTRDDALACANRMIGKLRDFRPDLVLSYAFGGLIELGGDDGGLTHLFELLGIPYVCLFYDTPFGLEEPLRRWGASKLASFVCWDRKHLSYMRSLGARRLLYQPLGTNARNFASIAPQTRRWSCSFVGSIQSELLNSPLPGSAALAEIVRRFIELRLEQPCCDVETLLNRVGDELPPGKAEGFKAFLQTPQSFGFRQDLLARSDVAYRQLGVKRAGMAGGITFFGCAAWESGDLPGVAYGGPVAYGPALGCLYAASGINLNFTAGHLRDAVNQRVFDAPAAGGFVLTDYRRDLEDLFDLKSEIACFRTLDDMVEQLDRYRNDDAAQKRIAAAARRRVLAHHTWDRRLADLLAWFWETAGA